MEEDEDQVEGREGGSWGFVNWGEAEVSVTEENTGKSDTNARKQGKKMVLITNE